MKTNVVSGNCPECNSTISFNKTPYIGQSAYCDKCDSDLEVSQIDPLELEWLVGPGFMESNDQRFTKRRARAKQGEERKIDPKRAQRKKRRKRRVVSNEWENEWESEDTGSRSRPHPSEQWADEE